MSLNNLQASESPKKRPVSVRKIEANRQNSLKSTGPRTFRGKANSRKNAIKHGLFVRVIDEAFCDEEPGKFLVFYNRLWDEMEPVGPCEESEVEYIAICWLRLARLWRYENAEIRSGNDLVQERVENGFYNVYNRVPSRRTLMSLLRSAESEVETNGHISPELTEKLFSEDVHIELMWESHEARAEMTAPKKYKRHCP